MNPLLAIFTSLGAVAFAGAYPFLIRRKKVREILASATPERFRPRDTGGFAAISPTEQTRFPQEDMLRRQVIEALGLVTIAGSALYFLGDSNGASGYLPLPLAGIFGIMTGILLRKLWRRRDAIYVAAVVGKPPQEDVILGNAVQDMFLPILKFIRPEVRDAWAFYETGFHGLFAVSMRPRYEKESIKTACSVLGEGQVSLTKVCVVVRGDVDCRDFRAILREWARRFDPSRDAILLPNTSADTLDFTGPRMNRGSKMILDLTGEAIERPRPEDLPDLTAAHEAVIEQRLVEALQVA